MDLEPGVAGNQFNKIKIQMKSYIKSLASIIFLAVVLSSCAESETNTKEEIEITTMDSTSKVLEENTDKLEEQTKKVEESLEKLDKEFDTTN